jgi:hypothetical protein
LYICDEEEKRILKAINKIKKKNGEKNNDCGFGVIHPKTGKS